MLKVSTKEYFVAFMVKSYLFLVVLYPRYVILVVGEASSLMIVQPHYNQRTWSMLKVRILASKSRTKGYYSNLNNQLQLQKEGALCKKGIV